MDPIELKDQQHYGRRYLDKYNDEGFISYYLIINFFIFFYCIACSIFICQFIISLY